MPSNRTIKPSTLSISDLPWQIKWDKDKCTLCGKCTSVCPVRAIELKVFRKKSISVSIDLNQANKSDFQTFFGINQQNAIENTCMGCGMWVYWGNTHICCKAGSYTANAWPEYAETRKAEALERIADALEKIAKRLKK